MSSAKSSQHDLTSGTADLPVDWVSEFADSRYQKFLSYVVGRSNSRGSH